MKKFKNIILLVCLFILFSCSKKSKLNDQIVKEDIVKISISSNLSSHKEIIEDKKDIYNIYDFFDVVHDEIFYTCKNTFFLIVSYLYLPS